MEYLLTAVLIACIVLTALHIIEFFHEGQQLKKITKAVAKEATAKSRRTSAYSSQNTSDDKLQHRDFLLSTLNKLGCKPILSEQSNNIYLKYQGEAFCIVQDRNFIRIWDLPYYEVNVLDTSLPLIIESINSANFSVGPAIVISEPDENGNREIQSKMDLIFIPSLPNPEKYLSKILDLFFDLKIRLRTEIAKWNTPEAQNQPSSLTVFPYQN